MAVRAVLTNGEIIDVEYGIDWHVDDNKMLFVLDSTKKNTATFIDGSWLYVIDKDEED